MVASSLVNLFLFKPPKATPYSFPTKPIRLKTAKGSQITATYIRRRGAHITVLFSHGNAEDLNTCYWWIKRLSVACDVNVMAYDYTGYGESTGKPSESNCYADIDAVYDYLIQERNIPPEQIVLYGRSLGSGPSCYLAHKSAQSGRSVAGLILHSPFTSVYRVVLDVGITVLGDKFPNIDRIPECQCPVLIVHGHGDEVVPFEHGQALHEAVPETCKAEPFFEKDMGHNNHSLQVEMKLLDRINEYLDYHILARRLWMKPRKSY